MTLPIAVIAALLLGQAAPGDVGASSGVQEDRDRIEQVLATYDRGLAQADLELLLSVVGDGLIMFNGAYSGDPTDWEAHLYLDEAELRPWLSNFISRAGPHRNRFVMLSLNVRGNAAVATTLNAGSNRFRSWRDERVTWLLGRTQSRWRILGFFIRDIRNPQ